VNLPDFREYGPFKSLSKEMGISDGARSSFKYKLNWNSVTPFDLETLNNSGLEIEGFKGIHFLADGTISYKNTRVLLHLSEWRPGQELDSSFSFHFSKCRTVKEMQRLGRSKRYIISTRTDGIFKYKLIQEDNSEKLKEDRLNVCKNCLSQLNYHNYGYNVSSLDQKRKASKAFRLNEFFIRFSCSPANNTLRITKPIFNEDWDRKHLDHLIRSHWKCYSCNSDFSNRMHKMFLHTHHKDGNPYNNESSNIEVLCNKCHTAKPNHFYLKAL